MKNICEDYGNWSVFETVDLNDVLGFTYIIEFDNGKKYIGAKKIWKRIKQSPSEFKRGPKRGFEQSDWRTYLSSSSDVTNELMNGAKIQNQIITGWFKNWGMTLYAEAVQQISNRVLSKNTIWLNKQIEGHFVPGCDDPSVYVSVRRISDYLKGSSDVDVLSSCIVFDDPISLFGGSGTKIKSIKEFTKNIMDQLSVDTDQVLKLIDGSIDSIDDRLFLDKEFQMIKNPIYHIPTKTEFRTYKEAQEKFGLKKKEIEESPDFEIRKVETRTAFKDRLKSSIKYSFKLAKVR